MLSTPLFAGQSSQGAFFSAAMFLQHERATGTPWHPSHSKCHEAGFVLANERSSRCWTRSISGWATRPRSQQWSARAAASQHSQLAAVMVGKCPPVPFHSVPPCLLWSQALLFLFQGSNWALLLQKHKAAAQLKPPWGCQFPTCLEKCSTPACSGLLLALPSHDPWSQLFVLRLTRWKSVINCDISCWIQEQDTGLHQGGIRSERRGLHMFTTELIYLKSFLCYMNSFLLSRACSSPWTCEVGSPSQKVEIILKSLTYCFHLAFRFCCVCSIPLRGESGAFILVISHPTETRSEAFHKGIY